MREVDTNLLNFFNQIHDIVHSDRSIILCRNESVVEKVIPYGELISYNEMVCKKCIIDADRFHTVIIISDEIEIPDCENGGISIMAFEVMHPIGLINPKLSEDLHISFDEKIHYDKESKRHFQIEKHCERLLKNHSRRDTDETD